MQKHKTTGATRVRRDGIAATAASLQRAGLDGLATLLRDTLDGTLAVLVVTDRNLPIAPSLLMHDKPIVALIIDHDDSLRGPCGWCTAAAVIASCRAAVMTTAGVTPEIAHVAAAGARMLGRVALIWTDSANLLAWTDALGEKPSLAFWPNWSGAAEAQPTIH